MGCLCRGCVVVVGLDVGTSRFRFVLFSIRVIGLCVYRNRTSLSLRIVCIDVLFELLSLETFCRGSTLLHARMLYNNPSRNNLKGFSCFSRGFIPLVAKVVLRI